jgi:sigma-B regulation protein RsbU (phosphoserine phosphatase)
VFDPATGTLRYVNAGQVAPILIRRTPLGQNAMERLTEGGPVLGLLPTARYSIGAVQLAACDSLILYSDGITEAIGDNDEEFGEERVSEIVARYSQAAPAEICERIMGRVSAFASATTPADDQTLMVVRFLSPAAKSHVDSGIVEEALA